MFSSKGKMTQLEKAKDNYNSLLNLAVLAAKKCAQVIIECSNPTVLGIKSSVADLTSLADFKGESAIREIITSARPSDGLLGEEGSDKFSDTGLRWVFDPLDGTINYLYRVPHWAISIACEQLNEEIWKPIVGVVLDVLRGETFTAIRGRGAYLNGKMLLIQEVKDFSDALIATGFSSIPSLRVRQGQKLIEILPKVRDIRSSGSSALDLCWVAAGRWSGFYEEELYRWDWSAASLIVEEAGGCVSSLGAGVIAGAPKLHKELVGLLKKM